MILPWRNSTIAAENSNLSKKLTPEREFCFASVFQERSFHSVKFTPNIEISESFCSVQGDRDDVYYVSVTLNLIVVFPLKRKCEACCFLPTVYGMLPARGGNSGLASLVCHK